MKYAFKVYDIPVNKNMIFTFSCDDKTFLQKLANTLTDFVQKYSGEIEITTEE